MEFAQAVEDYIGWMKANGYADSTIRAHANALKRFGKFVESALIPWPESLTYAFVRHYRQAEGPWARTDAVRGLSRFLCAKGFVRPPIEKPVRKLPEIYEDYLAYLKNARGVGDGYLDDARRLLSAFVCTLKGADSISVASISNTSTSSSRAAVVVSRRARTAATVRTLETSSNICVSSCAS